MKSQNNALEMELYGRHRGYGKRDKRSKESYFYDDEDDDFDVDDYDPDEYDDWD